MMISGCILNYRRVNLWLFFLLYFGVFSAAAPAVGQSSSEDLLDFLFTQNELSRQKILSGSYSLEEKLGETPESLNHEQGQRFADVYFDRDLRSISRREVDGIVRDEFSDPHEYRSIETRAVVGGEYSGIWTTHDPVGYQYDHQSVENIKPETADRVLSFAGEDFLNVGFGLGGQPLRDIYKTTISREKWAVDWKVERSVDSLGKNLYCLKGFTRPVDGKVRLSQEYVLNADQGFLMVDAKFYGVDGEVVMHEQVTPGDLTGTGVWGPVAMVQRNGPSLDENPQDTSFIREIKLNFDSVNQEVDPALFTMAALGMPDGLLVAKEDVLGETTTYQVLNGIPLPQQLFIAAQRGVKTIEDLDEVVAEADRPLLQNKDTSGVDLTSGPDKSNGVSVEIEGKKILIFYVILGVAISVGFVMFVWRRKANAS